MSRRNTCSAYPALNFFPSFFLLVSHPLAVVPCRRHHEGASVQVTLYPLQLTRWAQDGKPRPGRDYPHSPEYGRRYGALCEGFSTL